MKSGIFATHTSREMKEEVQMGKGVCMANLFHFLLSCGKAALLPFLAIYFRMLGLSATQVGAVFCVKGLMALWTAPLWTACAKWCNKKKGVLALSLVFLTGSTVMLALVPPSNPDLPELFCNRNLNYSTLQLSKLPTWMSDHLRGHNGNPTPSNDSEVNQGGLLPNSNGQQDNPKGPDGPDVNQTLSTPTSTESPAITETTPTTVTTTLSTTTTQSTTTTTVKIPPTESLESLINDFLKDVGGKNNGNNGKDVLTTKSTTTEIPSTISFVVEPIDTHTNVGTGTEDVTQIMKELQNMGLSVDMINKFLSMSDAEQKEFLNEITKNMNNPVQKKTTNYHTSQHHHKTRRLLALSDAEPNLNHTDMQSSLKETFDYLMDQCTFCKGMHSTFVFIMALVVIGELFSSPVDKLSDDIWFEYLDVVDALDRYGSHRAWASLGLVITSPVVTIIVDHLPCTLPKGLSSFNIHFFVFVGFMVFAFIAVCAYPVSTNRRTAKRSKLGKGMKVLCSDSHAIVYTFTMLVVAVCYAPVFYFLMWQMQDLEGSEIVMGASVAAASFSELLVFPIKGWLITHITHAGAVGISLIVLAVRLVFYSFMWSPWMAVIGEFSQGITLSLLWTTIQTYGDFRCNPYIMDRSAYHVVNALYAFGLVLGAALSGILYDTFGMAVLLRASAVGIGVWLVIFLCVTMCTKKKEKVRYAALLQDEEDFSSDEDNTIYQDDWLEVALTKSNKWK